MMQTVALIANGNPQFQMQKPTRFGETKSGKYIVYEINKANERIKQ
jgi:hypothetical protein